MSKRLLVLFALLTFGLMIAGCSEGDKSNTVVNPNPDIFAPTGSISGIVMDDCASTPVQGAVVAVAYSGSVKKVTTDASGMFSFNNVPASYDSYYVVATLPAAYGGFSLIETAWVGYEDLYDGYNYNYYSGDFTESGSGASTPVDKLASSVYFQAGPAASSISGAVLDASTVATTPLADATVKLFIGGDFFASATTGATGAFSFTQLPPYQSYYLQVTKANYTYVTSVVAGSPSSCGDMSVGCQIGCYEDLAGIIVWLEYDPFRDIVAPYITQIDADADLDIIYDDVLSGQVSEFVVTFSEAMATDRRSTKWAVDVWAGFYVVATSSGNAAVTDAGYVYPIEDWTVAWDTTGTQLTITPIYYSAADIIAQLGAPATTWDPATVVTFAISDNNWGEYYLDFYQGQGYYQLTDANLVPWYYNEWDANSDGYLYAAGAWYQEIILDGSSYLYLYLEPGTALSF